MKKRFFIIFFLLVILTCSSFAFADDEADEWSKHLDVYNSDGLDKPVSAIDYQKTINELNKLKESKKKKKRLKKGEMPDEPLSSNEPVKVERYDILKTTHPLYYDGIILPVGYYKIVAEKDKEKYFIKLIQGKTTILKINANKTAYMDFCKDKVNCLETEIFKDKYFKINFKTIDYAITGYLAIVK